MQNEKKLSIKTWCRDFARPTGINYNHCAGPSVIPICFSNIPSGTGYWLIYVHHGSCKLQSVDSNVQRRTCQISRNAQIVTHFGAISKLLYGFASDRAKARGLLDCPPDIKIIFFYIGIKSKIYYTFCIPSQLKAQPRCVKRRLAIQKFQTVSNFY